MTTFLTLMLVIDLGLGISSGLIGHIYALVFFPILALLRGYLGASKHKNYKDTFFVVFSGASLLFIGVVIGMIIKATQLDSAIPQNSIGKAINLSLITAFIYFLIYMLLGFLSAYLCVNYKDIQKIQKKEKESQKKQDTVQDV